MVTLTHRLLSAHVLLLSVLCSSAVAAFSWQQKGTAAGVTVTERNNGQTVTVAREGTLEVRLKSQMGTGYSWEVMKIDGRRLKLLGGPELTTVPSGPPGGVEHQVFQFKALRAGTSFLELVYVRPWERNAEPAKTVRLTVRVR